MRDRRFLIMMSASIALHLLVGVAVLLLMRVSPAMKDGPEKPTEVELVMEEHKGDARPSGGPQSEATKEASKESPPSASDQRREKAEKQTQTDPAVDARAEQPVETKQEAEKSVDTAAPSSPPAQPAPQPAPVISLSGTDSPSNALAFGDHIIPASPDAVFHNRPPVYPDEAALAGEHGVVILAIHIAPSGQVAGADVLRSSGYVRLDQAAREAVLRWRFLPAVKGGQPVGSDMRMQFDFEAN
jgi:protein TonB